MSNLSDALEMLPEHPLFEAAVDGVRNWRVAMIAAGFKAALVDAAIQRVAAELPASEPPNRPVISTQAGRA